MFLIMSGAFVDQELRAEFGAIPPSFLPLGNKRLFQHQLALVPEGRQVYLSLPETYKISATDKRQLRKNNIQIIITPLGLSLGEGLVSCLNLIEQPLNSPLHLLFGDTLLKKLPEGDDVIATSAMADSYDWSVVSGGNVDWLSTSKQDVSTDQNNVVCGYFKFSQPRVLVRSITQEKWDFLKGLNRYHSAIGLSQVGVTNWFDFGHVNTYYHSKAEFTTQRAFNDLTINSKWIEKSSIKNTKIRAEANWFDQIPPMMRGYIPQYLGQECDDNGRFSYRLEYLHNTALNELYVFSEMPNIVWNKIIVHCLEFIDACRKYEAPANAVITRVSQLFGEKTDQRLQEFEESKEIKRTDLWVYNSSDISIKNILDLSKKHLPKKSANYSLMHGDFCFSNILYDFRSDRIKTIDPRGLTPDEKITPYGHINYDIAKLSHSVLGMYDWILAGYHATDINWDSKEISFSISGEKKHKTTQTLFIEMVNRRWGLTALNLYAMQLELFLSMLPLHSDDPYRQAGLFANAFRLYELMKRYEQ